ncbi:MAG: TlpA disulfide reductase family protein [Planctomycetota bacterium]
MRALGSRPLAVALLLAAAVGCGDATGSRAEVGPTAPPLPETIEPQVVVADLDELLAALEDRRGRAYLLNVWAMWCGPCIAELPELVDAAHEWRPKGGDVVTVSFDLVAEGGDENAMREKVVKYMERKRWDLDVFVYRGADTAAINEHFDLPDAIPVTLAIDAAGNVVDRHEGRGNRARFRRMMRRAVGVK